MGFWGDLWLVSPNHLMDYRGRYKYAQSNLGVATANLHQLVAMTKNFLLMQIHRDERLVRLNTGNTESGAIHAKLCWALTFHLSLPTL